MRFSSDIMIDLTDDLIKIAKDCESLTGGMFRIFPQKKMAGKTYAVITPTMHAPRLMESGQEVIADLGWNVQVFGAGPKECDVIASELTDLYGKHNLMLNGITHGYSPEYRAYTVLISYSATVDRRGCVYTG